MLPHTPLSKTIDQRLSELQTKYHQSDIPLTVRLTFMLDCLRLLSRLPAAITKEMDAIRALTPETASNTARKTIAKRCKAWLLTQQSQPGGFDKEVVLCMELVLEVLNEYEREERGNWTEHLHFFLAGVMVIDDTLNPAIEALMKQHFGDY